jgi:dUTP pyrophosphatase
MRTLFIHTSNDELKKRYMISVEEHNRQVISTHPNSGFDLFSPERIVTNMNTIKLDTQITCSMIDDNKQNCGFYLYPRSSISKTNLRLANSVGIIDSGYRGNLLAILDNILKNDNVSTTIEEQSRLIQICGGDLQPFIVVLVDDVKLLGETARGTGGFGSTGV